MTKVQSSFNVLAPTAAVWPSAADIDRWACYLPDAKRKGWGDRFELWPKKEAAVGAQIIMRNAENLPVQAWEIEDWQPGVRFKAAKREQIYPVFGTAISFEVVLSKVTDSETRVDAVLEMSFTDMGIGLLLNLLAPVKGDMAKFLEHWEKGVLNALSGAPQ